MTVQENFVATTPDGAALRVWSEGIGPATVLLVSGLGGTGGFWSGISARLAGQARVLRFDQRGIGASSRGDTPCTIDQLARDCLSVLDAAGVERCVLVGHSTGGCIGQALARLAPERLFGLVLSATWLGPNRYMQALFTARLSLLDASPADYAASSALLGYPPDWVEANWAVVESAVANAPSTALARQVVRERISALLAFDGGPGAPELDLPTLVLGARDDMIVPAFLQEDLARSLPCPQRAVFDGGGHFFPVSRPDAFMAELTGWLGTIEKDGR